MLMFRPLIGISEAGTTITGIRSISMMPMVHIGNRGMTVGPVVPQVSIGLLM